MKVHTLFGSLMAPTTRLAKSSTLRRHLTLNVLAVMAFSGGSAHAFDFGPFSLTGFAKVETSSTSNTCTTCQLYPNENKERYWADYLVGGTSYGTSQVNTVLFQPYLGAKFDLGSGYKLSGLLSQRWRNETNNLAGTYQRDIPGFWYEKNLAVSHEDYGSVRIGAMTTRGWSVADYPYGTNLNMASFWGASGAAYGHMISGIRYTSPVLDTLQGDLVLEGSYSGGNMNFTQHKPQFLELYGQYHRGDLVVDAVMQTSKNGTPSSWGETPFTGPTPFAANDSVIGSNGQAVAIVMGRYQVTSQIEVSGGFRRNSWSGAYAEITSGSGATAQWNNMFNVDWSNPITLPNGTITYPGYSATSNDLMLGARYRMGKWTASAGMTYLGTAQTSNPSERGQRNWALVDTVGLTYTPDQLGWLIYGFAGALHYGRIGLAPMSMPGNNAFYNIDSRVTQNGNWLGAGITYVF